MAVVTTPSPRTDRRTRSVSATPRAFYWMVLPACALFFLLHTVPVLQGVYYSLTDYAGYGDHEFVGLRNYLNLFEDERVWDAYAFTFRFAVVSTVLVNVLALALALGLNARIRFRTALRGVFFVPNVLPILIVGYVFNYLFSNSLPALGEKLGVTALSSSILADPDLAWVGVVVVAVWQATAFNMIVYLAGLQTVPSELYEAATVDGANAWQRFRHVTWPLITPVTLFQLIVGIINSLQVFTQPYLLAQQRLNQASGGPENSLLTYSLYLFQNAFVHLKMGYAAAMAWILFLITVVLTALVLATSKRWVHYGSR